MSSEIITNLASISKITPLAKFDLQKDHNQGQDKPENKNLGTGLVLETY